MTLTCSSGILPPHSDSHSLVGNYRKEQYQDIMEALEVMRFIKSSTPSTHVYLRMFQLESHMLPRCSEISPPVRWRFCRVNIHSPNRVFVRIHVKYVFRRVGMEEIPVIKPL